jgi:hypothetical protein
VSERLRPMNSGPPPCYKHESVVHDGKVLRWFLLYYSRYSILASVDTSKHFLLCAFPHCRSIPNQALCSCTLCNSDANHEPPRVSTGLNAISIDNRCHPVQMYVVGGGAPNPEINEPLAVFAYCFTTNRWEHYPSPDGCVINADVPASRRSHACTVHGVCVNSSQSTSCFRKELCVPKAQSANVDDWHSPRRA